MSLYKQISRICAGLTNLNFSQFSQNGVRNGLRSFKFPPFAVTQESGIHISSKRFDLMEFFETANSSGEVRVGRAWRKDELRIKSNSDLHKLWYVLLKEKNMLLTMEHEFKLKEKLWPNPERLHKVTESMKNLESVVRERNRAYYLLETGQTGEQEVVNETNQFGLPYKRKMKEHYIDRHENYKYKQLIRRRHNNVVDSDVVSFLRQYKEKQARIKYYKQRQRYRHVCGLLRRFDDMDEEAIREEYPDVDLEKAKMDKLSRGPRVNPF